MACIKNLSFQILTISRVEKPSRWQLTALKTRTKLAWSECYVLCCAHLWRGWQCRLSGCGWPRRWWRAPPQASTRHPPACLSQPGAGSNLIQDCKYYYEPKFFELSNRPQTCTQSSLCLTSAASWRLVLVSDTEGGEAASETRAEPVRLTWLTSQALASSCKI